MKRKLWVLVIVVFLGFVVSSCTTPAGRTAGQVVDDASITTVVKAKLLGDSFLKGIAVSVSTFEGTVTLTGSVSNEKQRERVVSIARSVKGVKRVNNNIMIK